MRHEPIIREVGKMLLRHIGEWDVPSKDVITWDVLKAKKYVKFSRKFEEEILAYKAVPKVIQIGVFELLKSVQGDVLATKMEQLGNYGRAEITSESLATILAGCEHLSRQMDSNICLLPTDKGPIFVNSFWTGEEFSLKEYTISDGNRWIEGARVIAPRRVI